jgi:hypothetical protein
MLFLGLYLLGDTLDDLQLRNLTTQRFCMSMRLGVSYPVPMCMPVSGHRRLRGRSSGSNSWAVFSPGFQAINSLNRSPSTRQSSCKSLQLLLCAGPQSKPGRLSLATTPSTSSQKKRKTTPPDHTDLKLHRPIIQRRSQRAPSAISLARSGWEIPRLVSAARESDAGGMEMKAKQGTQDRRPEHQRERLKKFMRMVHR